jgi:addiction module HigA family antidote
MLITKRKPASVGEMLIEEFMAPLGLTQGALAEAMGVQRKHVNELCNNRRSVTAPTALILARVFGNSPEFWLNVQRRSDLWEAMHSPRERERIKRARPLQTARAFSRPGIRRRLSGIETEVRRAQLDNKARACSIDRGGS